MLFFLYIEYRFLRNISVSEVFAVQKLILYVTFYFFKCYISKCNNAYFVLEFSARFLLIKIQHYSVKSATNNLFTFLFNIDTLVMTNSSITIFILTPLLSSKNNAK